ncbi:MAG: hypothetical protein FD153_1562 [Rhodospirillaceae bacterium]|nr:MAG: hypothetical protein FD153_1562 [Rhodospirillaceae bacterium]
MQQTYAVHVVGCRDPGGDWHWFTQMDRRGTVSRDSNGWQKCKRCHGHGNIKSCHRWPRIVSEVTSWQVSV